MVGEGHRDAVAQLRGRNLIVNREQNASVSIIVERRRILRPEGLDQIRRADEVHGVFIFFRATLVDSDGAPATGCRREIARLPPFECFLQFSNPLRRRGRLEDQTSKEH